MGNIFVGIRARTFQLAQSDAIGPARTFSRDALRSAFDLDPGPSAMSLIGDSLHYDNTAMPAVVFTDPQAASVGLTEFSARAAGYPVRTSVVRLNQVPRALAARDTRGLIKLVADGNTRRLLGAHVLAPEGADSIQTAVIAVRCRLTIDDFAEAIFPYLTTVEGLKLAAHLRPGHHEAVLLRGLKEVQCLSTLPQELRSVRHADVRLSD